MRYHPISHRIGHTIRWWAEPWSQNGTRTHLKQPSSTDGLGTVPHYTSDLPCTTLPGVTRMGFEPMLFSVKGRRLEPLVQRAKLWTLWESNPNDVVANHSTCRRHQAQLGAGEGIRTLNSQLGRLELYQLSYSRSCDNLWGRCHVLRERRGQSH